MESLHAPVDAVGDRTRGVRPYTVTRGRTRPARPDLPVEALVRAPGAEGAVRTLPAESGVNLPPEAHRIVCLAAEDFVSVAELSAHLDLPIGVVRVLVGDLEASGRVTVHGPTTPTSAPATSLSVLESVLDGISSL
jgi:Protein of unknown function (DUF742)